MPVDLCPDRRSAETNLGVSRRVPSSPHMAETGANNTKTRAFLEEGRSLSGYPKKAIAAADSPRHEPDGRANRVVHYDQPDHDLQEETASTCSGAVAAVERTGNAVSAGWQRRLTAQANGTLIGCGVCCTARRAATAQHGNLD